MIAVDTSVLVDLLAGGEHADAAEVSLRNALSKGPVVACEVVVGELVAGLGQGDEILQALRDIGIVFSPIGVEAAVHAGEMQGRFRQRRKAAGAATQPPRMVPDFLVGAHALLQCKGLVTRDAGFFRDYFKGLEVIVPRA